MEPSGAAEEEHWVFRWTLSSFKRQGKDRYQLCLLSCRFASGITPSRTSSPEKPQTVEPQNIAQGDLALPGAKRNAEVVSYILHFPCCPLPPSCRGGTQRCGLQGHGDICMGTETKSSWICSGKWCSGFWASFPPSNTFTLLSKRGTE